MSLIEFYGKALGGLSVARKADVDAYDVSAGEWVSHLRWMLGEMPQMQDARKVNRWLGFVQGVLWCLGSVSIADLRRHVREQGAPGVEK